MEEKVHEGFEKFLCIEWVAVRKLFLYGIAEKAISITDVAPCAPDIYYCQDGCGACRKYHDFYSLTFGVINEGSPPSNHREIYDVSSLQDYFTSSQAHC